MTTLQPRHRANGRPLVVVALLLLVTTSLRAQQMRPCPLCAVPTVGDTGLSAKTGMIVGIVVDTAHGEPAVGAVRLFKEHDDPKHGSGVATTRLQRGGGFVFTDIPPGRYDLLVRAIGMSFTVPSIAVKAGHIDTLTVRATNADWPLGLNNR